MDEKYLASEVEFQEILPVWQEKLWPGRKSVIERTSAINRNGSISFQLMDEKSYFWSVKVGLKTIGVIGSQTTGEAEFRSRGLWVDSAVERQGIGTLLLK